MLKGHFAELLRIIARDGSVGVVTLVTVRGSSPRDSGARMIVRRDGGFSGSIGGGALEWRALAEAQALLASEGRSARLIDQALGPDLGQCCGGHVRVLVERFSAADRGWLEPLASAEASGPITTIGTTTLSGHFQRVVSDEAVAPVPNAFLTDGTLRETFGTSFTPVFLAGAGHVGRALVLALAPLPFAVTWVDPRPGAFPSHAPTNVRPQTADPVEALGEQSAGAMILAMTHSHALDLAIVHAALRLERFASVGVIGSATKRARFSSQLRQAGLAQTAIDQLVCPLGLPGLGGKEPAVIAASIAAKLLMDREARAITTPVGLDHERNDRHVG